jgi:hypothetical protein
MKILREWSQPYKTIAMPSNLGQNCGKECLLQIFNYFGGQYKTTVYA